MTPKIYPNQSGKGFKSSHQNFLKSPQDFNPRLYMKI